MKNKLKLSTFILAIFFAFSFTNSTYASDDVRPIRIGIKSGAPILTGLNLEYVTPALKNRLSADLDLAYFPLTAGSATVNYLNLGLGANFYFFKPGRSLYGGIGYGRLAFTAKKTLTTNIDGEVATAEGEGSLSFNNLNLKIGGKHGGLFYFRWELGYGLTLSGGDLLVSADASAPGVKPVHIEEKISVPLQGLPIINCGFGFSF